MVARKPRTEKIRSQKNREIMNAQQNSFVIKKKTIEMEEDVSNRIPKIVLGWNSEGWSRKGKPRKQWMNGVRINIVSKELTEKMRRTENCVDAEFLCNKR